VLPKPEIARERLSGEMHKVLFLFHLNGARGRI